MKFSDRATEREWIRLASEGRMGRPMKRKDPGPSLKSRVSPLFGILAIASVISWLMGMNEPEMRSEHWQTMLSCLILIFTSLVGVQTLMHPINSRPGYVAAALNLPVSGESIIRWVRRQIWLRRFPKTLLICGVISLAVHGFEFSAPWKIAATALLLTATTFATTILLEDEWLQRLRIGRLWGVLVALLVVWLVALYISHGKGSMVGNPPDWMAAGVLRLSWIFPPSWCLPGRFEHGGFWLALPWIAWGATRWYSWPKRAGQHLDRLQDLNPAYDDSDEDDDSLDDESPELIEAHSEEKPEPRDDNRTTDLPEPLAMIASGWVERWVCYFIGGKNLSMAGAMVALHPAWTPLTNRVIRYAVPMLTFVWAFHRYFPDSKFKSTADLWMGIISFILPMGVLLPVTNAVPRATSTWALGGQVLPFFSMLPISVRDVLRVSMRVTLARCLIMVPLMTPIAAALLAIYHELGCSAWTACWMVPAVACFWVHSRPIFLALRFRSSSRRSKSLLIHTVLGLFSLISGLGWLAAGAIAGISGVMLFAPENSGTDRWETLAAFLGGLLVSGLCARAVFEIHVWKLKRRMLDWLAPAR